MYTFQSTIGPLKMHIIVVLKKEILNALMNRDIMR